MSLNKKQYWKYYGLNFDPFVTECESDAWYTPERWEQYFDLLQYLCTTSNLMLVVSGDKASGKTNFAKQFNSQLNDQMMSCEIHADSILHVESLLEQLLQKLSLTQSTTNNIEETLDKCLETLIERKQNYLFIIDNAERLPIKVLEALFYLLEQQPENHVHLHFLLLGSPEIRKTIESVRESKKQEGGVHYIDLKPFSVNETENYIAHRLLNAGLPSAMPLTAETITRICQLSNGIPLRINQFAMQTLIAASKKDWRESNVDFIQHHKTKLIGGSIFAFMLIISASIVAKNAHYPVIALMQPSQSIHKNSVTLKPRVKPSIAKPIIAKQIVLKPAAIKQTVPVMVATPKVATPSKPIIVAQNDVTSKPIIELKPTTIDIKPIATLPKAVAVKKDVTPNLLSVKLVTTNAIAAKSASKKTTVADVTANAILANPAIAMKPKYSTTKNQSKNKSISQSLSYQHLLTANSQHYTLQLIGLSSEAAMQRFIQTNGLGSQAIYYHSQLNGKDWYVLLYGEYSTSQAAKTALAALPEAVRVQHPWIRMMANVQLSLHRLQ